MKRPHTIVPSRTAQRAATLSTMLAACWVLVAGGMESHATPLGACPPADHPCSETGGPGCTDSACCATVCDSNPFCCKVAWDLACVHSASLLCPPPSKYECPDGPGAPPNDCAVDATPMAPGSSLAFDTSSASTDGPTNSQCSYGKDVWYLLQAPNDGQLTVVLDTPTFDSTLAVYYLGTSPDFDPNDLWVLFTGCVDAEGPGGETAVFPGVAGVYYLLQVAGFKSGPVPQSGPGTISVPSSGPACGDPGAGNCFEAHPGPACDQADCCNAVCAVLPLCCDVMWDLACVGNAQLLCESPTGTPFFTGLGQLPGSVAGSWAGGVSADGKVIVGGSGVFGDQAFRWTSEGGIIGLGFLPGGMTSWAEGVSGDGGVVVGTSSNASGLLEAFRWDAQNGMVGLGMLQGGTFSSATAVSEDGTVVVGQSGHDGGLQAFRWTASSGMVGLGTLPDASPSAESEALAVSPNGEFVVGQAENASGQMVAFAWSVGAGMQQLASIAGGNGDALPCDVFLRTGIVGASSSPASGPDLEATKWSAQGVPTALGDLPGGDFSSIAFSASSTGGIVVGLGTSAQGEEAFVWDVTHGLRQLEAVLDNDFKLDLTGWDLVTAISVSADGRTITGTGINPLGQMEGWTAYLGVASCVGDLDGDSLVGGADLGLLLSAWGSSSPGDLNSDGTVDGADLGSLLGAWGECGL